MSLPYKYTPARPELLLGRVRRRGSAVWQAELSITCLNERQEQGWGGTWPGSPALVLVRLVVFQEAFRGICKDLAATALSLLSSVKNIPGAGSCCQ